MLIEDSVPNVKESVNGLQLHKYSKDTYTIPPNIDDFLFIMKCSSKSIVNICLDILIA